MITCPELDICVNTTKSINDISYPDCTNFKFDPNIKDSIDKCNIPLNDEERILLNVGKLYSNNEKNVNNISNKCWGKMVFSDETNNNHLQYMGVGVTEINPLTKMNDINKYCCKITNYNLSQDNNHSWECAKITTDNNIKQSFDSNIKKNISLKKIMNDYNVINQSNNIPNYNHSPEMNHYINNMCCISQLQKSN